MDKEAPIVKTGRNGISVYDDVGIFFPIICTFSSELISAKAMSQTQRRKDSSEPERDPTLLRLKINDVIIPKLLDYYAESTEFKLEISEMSPILRYLRTITVGKGEAIIAGYWLLLKPLSVGIYRIMFEGKHRDGFKTSGDYSIKVVRRTG